jgi:Flp pilus assembly protein TadB
VSETLDRRNPLRLIVSKETQLRILWLVGGGVFFCMAATMAIVVWVGHWIWAIALGLVVGAFVSLWVSRRISGPFYRIEKDLEALLNGAVAGRKIHLRPGDPLQHLAALVNQLIAKIHG